MIAWSQVEFLELVDRAYITAVHVKGRILQMRVDLNFAGRGLPRRVVPARSPVIAVPTGSISIIEVRIRRTAGRSPERMAGRMVSQTLVVS